MLTVCLSKIAPPRRVRFSSRLTHPTPHLGVHRHIRGLNSHFGEWRSTQYKGASASSNADGWPAESLPRLTKRPLTVTPTYGHNVVISVQML